MGRRGTHGELQGITDGKRGRIERRHARELQTYSTSTKLQLWDGFWPISVLKRGFYLFSEPFWSVLILSAFRMLQNELWNFYFFKFVEVWSQRGTRGRIAEEERDMRENCRGGNTRGNCRGGKHVREVQRGIRGGIEGNTLGNCRGKTNGGLQRGTR